MVELYRHVSLCLYVLCTDNCTYASVYKNKFELICCMNWCSINWTNSLIYNISGTEIRTTDEPGLDTTLFFSSAKLPHRLCIPRCSLYNVHRRDFSKWPVCQADNNLQPALKIRTHGVVPPFHHDGWLFNSVYIHFRFLSTSWGERRGIYIVLVGWCKGRWQFGRQA